jgi:DNA-binding transcriptional ArsR family regulator
MTNEQDLAKIFKALSDPNRLKILQILRECCGPGGQCDWSAGERDNTVSKVAECFDLALSTVSHHIKELKNAGLIVCEKRGQTVCCGPNEEVLEKLREYLEPRNEGGSK